MMQRLRIAHLPTPLVQAPRLSDTLDVNLWIKRDDATGGPEAGNKIRKLEYLLADAHARSADVVITCGGAQSNHARATAVLAASLGLRAVLLLRSADGQPPAGPPVGNLLIARMVGADVRFISPDDYQRRDVLLANVADELRELGATPYVIGEGGSNGLGAMGYVSAMEEIGTQLEEKGERPFDLIVHACGSGGTAAGIAIGAAKYQVAERVLALAVCDDVPTFSQRIGEIIDECRSLDAGLPSPVPWRVDDSYKGSAYAVSSKQQRERMLDAARLEGLILDPVYTGKAFHGLWDLTKTGKLGARRVLFVHTGGLPGLMAQASTFATELC
jgi:D-cysteine desulfhydrase